MVRIPRHRVMKSEILSIDGGDSLAMMDRNPTAVNPANVRLGESSNRGLCLVAPKKLSALLDSAEPGKPPASNTPPPKKRRSNRA
jgi:hypothetical protein